ncbi:hypothetical protein EFA69_06505 [Rufibacter immobilis]|uniref:Uncharacterized protein n=1 Tax=Rufibacter immobilis TaxID=1348778 RepID=A0A3M9N1N1_9BACT|nr:hypothetical protein [Rufibacter immobilis]RNI30938.1 hypothetical protein EFA69_06505 [Rufibacter immobilis]
MIGFLCGMIVGAGVLILLLVVGISFSSGSTSEPKEVKRTQNEEDEGLIQHQLYGLYNALYVKTRDFYKEKPTKEKKELVSRELEAINTRINSFNERHLVKTGDNHPNTEGYRRVLKLIKNNYWK